MRLLPQIIRDSYITFLVLRMHFTFKIVLNSGAEPETEPVGSRLDPAFLKCSRGVKAETWTRLRLHPKKGFKYMKQKSVINLFLFLLNIDKSKLNKINRMSTCCMLWDVYKLEKKYYLNFYTRSRSQRKRRKLIGSATPVVHVTKQTMKMGRS